MRLRDGYKIRDGRLWKVTRIPASKRRGRKPQATALPADILAGNYKVLESK